MIATRESFPGGLVFGFAELPNGDILASIRDRGLYRFDGTSWKAVWGQGSSWILRNVHDGDTTTVWAAQKGGTDVFRLKKKVWEKFGSVRGGISCFLPLSDDQVLVSSTKGMFRLTNGKRRRLEMRPEIGIPNVRSMLLDANGTLWIGAHEGLIRGSPRTWQGDFTTDDDVKLVSLARNRDDASPLWFVDEKHRLARFKGTRLHAFLQLRTTDGFDVGVFAFSGEDSVWGLSHKKVQEFSLRDGSLEDEWTNDGEAIRLHKFAKAGYILLTSLGAFQRRDGKWVNFPVIDGYKRKRVFDLIELENGVLLAGVEDGVELWNVDSVEHVKNTKHDFHSIHMRPNGRIWLGSLGQGVMLFDGVAAVEADRTVTSDRQLVTNVYEARDGTLWTSLRRGGIASLRDGRRITYRYDHGLPNSDIDCLREDDHGNIWISVRGGGVYAFQPDRSPPDTRILDSTDEVSSHGIASFSFTGWDAWGHTPRSGLVYSWRILTERDGEVVLPWSDGSLETRAVTSALDPGRYRLEVRAADQDRNVDPTPATYAFRVQYPLWQQSAYMVPIAALSLSVVLACFLWYRTCARRQRAEFERAHFERYADDLEVAVAERTAESVESARRLRLVFENAPTCLWHEDLSRIKREIDRLKQSGVEDFRQYFESHPDVVAEWVAMIMVLDVNRSTFEFHEAGSKDELIDSMPRIFNENTHQVFREELIALAAGALSFESDAELKTLDGETKSVLYKMFVNPDSANWSSVFVAITDFTERKHAEVELSESEGRIRALLEGAFEGIVVSEKGRLLEANHAFADMFGYAIDEIDQLSYLDLTSPESVPAVARHIEAGDENPYEIVGLQKDGTTFDVELLGKNCIYRGRVARITAMRDITERKRAEEELRQLQHDLAHVSRISTMGEMATGIAHELNQPLTAIASYSFTASSLVELGSSDTHDIKEILGKLEDQAIRAGDIVRRLRDFVRKTESVRSEVDLTTLVQEVATFVESDIHRAETVLVLNGDEPPPLVVVDEIQIQQVLVNLIRNSIDAMRETPTSQRKVTVSAGMLPNGKAEVTVCDTGQGLAQDELDQVFNAFFTTKQEGMGMGLAISRSIIEAHAGKIWAKPNRGPGVTFGFTIPQRNGHGA